MLPSVIITVRGRPGSGDNGPVLGTPAAPAPVPGTSAPGPPSVPGTPVPGPPSVHGTEYAGVRAPNSRETFAR
ncbi:hypothetical protein SSCG_03737 [Streptomyces clavuligerus]|nr:hypothetical protein SSCG_03737 [Streptomyces clavuligerus]